LVGCKHFKSPFELSYNYSVSTVKCQGLFLVGMILTYTPFLVLLFTQSRT